MNTLRRKRRINTSGYIREREGKVVSGRPRSSPRSLGKTKYPQQGEAFGRLLEERSLTLSAVAARVNRSVEMISSLRAGRTLPSEDTKQALKELLGISLVEDIGWPKAYSPLSYARPSKAAPPGSIGATLKSLRLELPGPPTQDEMASLLGVLPRQYRYVETSGGKRRSQQILALMQAYHATYRMASDPKNTPQD